MISNFFLIFILLKVTSSYNLCVIGATSGLGKEIIYQGITERKMSVLGLSGSCKKITLPCRINSFEEIYNQEEFCHENLDLDIYWNDISKYDYEHLILTTSAKPFEVDYSDIIMKKLLENIPESCKSISLISAYGAGNTLKNSNIGIRVMNVWYLKDVYRAKNEQEKMLNNYFGKNKVKKYIYMPKALSYGDTVINSVSRKDLANEILNNINSTMN